MAMSLPKAPSTEPQPIRFVGRRRELARLDAELRKARLVTIVGPGGTGKTRLAAEFGRRNAERFPDGIHFVSLAAVGSVEFLPHAVADAIGFVHRGAGELSDALLAHVSGMDALLVLDNLEHLLGGAGFVHQMLRSSTGLRIVVTSRAPLGVRRERVLPIGGLGTGEGAELAESVELFLACASHLGPDQAEAEREAITRICRAVDGSPLGIELAAAWARELPCDEIAARIQSNAEFLESKLAEVPDWHGGLRAVISHAWEGISAEERELFRSISVFRGGFEKGAAAWVAGAQALTLAQLVERAFLRRDPAGRYDTHDVLRQFAAARLAESPEVERAIRERHCAFFATFMRRYEGSLREGEQREALERIREELENVRAGWAWAVENGRVGELDTYVQGLARFYEIRSWFREGASLLMDTVERLSREREDGPGNGPDEVRARLMGTLLSYHGWFLYQVGSYAAARESVARGVDLYTSVGADGPLSRALSNLGTIAYALGEYAEARDYHDRALGIARGLGHAEGVATALNNLATVAVMVGEVDASRAYLRESLAMFRESTGNPWRIGYVLNNLGYLEHLAGNHLEGKALLEESLAIRRGIGHRAGVANSLSNLGFVSTALGELAEAASAFREAMGAAEEVGARPILLEVVVGIAAIHRLRGEEGEAERLARLVARHPASDAETRSKAAALLPGATPAPPGEDGAARLDRELDDVIRDLLRGRGSEAEG